MSGTGSGSAGSAGSAASAGVDIQFAVYPTTNRVPGIYSEVNNANANTAQGVQRALLIGQMTSEGNATPNVAVISAGVGDAPTKYGQNSMLAQMLQMYRLSDTFGEVWCLPLQDATGAIAATGTITPAGSPTTTADLYVYIAGSPINPRYVIQLTAGMTPAEMGAAIAEAINAVPTSPVTAAADATTGVVTVTAVNAGAAGNGIDMRLNYLGTTGGETTPAGVTITFGGTVSGTGTLLAGGETNPTLTAALANLSGQTTFDFIGLAYNDATSLNAIQAFLNDTTGRWSWSQMLFGGAWTTYRGTLGQLSAFGVTRNDQHTQIPGVYDTPTPEYLCTADTMANCAVSIRANPAIPLQELALQQFAPPVASQFDIGEQNTLLYDGISTSYVVDGVVYTQRICTTYQLNAAGAPDNSYLDTETLYTLQYIIRDLKTWLSSKYSRNILVANGTSIPYGSAMVTAQTVLASVVARYSTYCKNGLAQNAAQFAKQALAQNAGSGLVKLMLPIQVADQLRQIAMLVQFTKP